MFLKYIKYSIRSINCFVRRIHTSELEIFRVSSMTLELGTRT